jgi:hypothetical protein
MMSSSSPSPAFDSLRFGALDFMVGAGISAGSMPAALALSISLACLMSWDLWRFDMIPSFGGLPGPFRFSTTWPISVGGRLCCLAISSVMRPSISPASSSPSKGLRNKGGLSFGTGLVGSTVSLAGVSFAESSVGVSSLIGVLAGAFAGAFAGALPLSLISFGSLSSLGSLDSLVSLTVHGVAHFSDIHSPEAKRHIILKVSWPHCTIVV